jgi:hypothetical protein
MKQRCLPTSRLSGPCKVCGCVAGLVGQGHIVDTLGVTCEKHCPIHGNTKSEAVGSEPAAKGASSECPKLNRSADPYLRVRHIAPNFKCCSKNTLVGFCPLASPNAGVQQRCGRPKRTTHLTPKEEK